MSYTALGFLIAAIFLFACFVVASVFNFKMRFKKPYHLRSHFPYELNYRGNYKDNIYGNIIYAIYVLAVIVFLVFFDTTHNSGYLIVGLVAASIVLISLSFLVYVPVDHLRVHMLIVAFAFIFSLTLASATTIGSYFKYKENNNVPSLISFIGSIIMVASYVILILNPKLSHWAEMDQETKEDGTVVQVRPKYFVLAYSEWAMMILFPLNLLFLFIETI